ncbi:hypothetical protein [Pasteurella multocida]|uniref:hypothetical protein n=1 Tax=Pasteurella multocida TaxID=747 RepID=UPI002E316222|nr:hypothetical protein [Pasteurella multocida]
MAIEKIIIHCAATQNGVRLAKRGKTAAQSLMTGILTRIFGAKSITKLRLIVIYTPLAITLSLIQTGWLNLVAK